MSKLCSGNMEEVSTEAILIRETFQQKLRESVTNFGD